MSAWSRQILANSYVLTPWGHIAVTVVLASGLHQTDGPAMVGFYIMQLCNVIYEIRSLCNVPCMNIL